MSNYDWSDFERPNFVLQKDGVWLFGTICFLLIVFAVLNEKFHIIQLLAQ